MSILKRFRVGGSDLLAPPDYARRKVANRLTDKPPRLEVKVNAWPWRETGGKFKVMQRLDEWMNSGRGTFRVALRNGKERQVLIVLNMETVPRLSLANASPATIELHSLVQARFPGIRFAGAYVWKETSPGSWSDHAWGTAVDETENRPEGITNDEVTDWAARMARAGFMRFDYALGSRGGDVVQVDSDGDIFPSGASTSHLWHVHFSVTDHDGRKPPRTGGVF